MEMDSASNTTQTRHNVLCKQPISCPWINSQPYPSTANRNKVCEFNNARFVPNIPISTETRTADKTCPALSQSSSQFFYFLRLMQLFPETHPATLHTVMTLCKNDFFGAVDKLLYAKRCKALYKRSQVMFKSCAFNRTHPYCREHCKSCPQKADHIKKEDDNTFDENGYKTRGQKKGHTCNTEDGSAITERFKAEGIDVTINSSPNKESASNLSEDFVIVDIEGDGSPNNI